MRTIRTIRTLLVTTLGLLCLPVFAPAVSEAAPSYAPHIDRRIIATKASFHGPQIATWYGPGLYGNRTACGQTLRRGTWGIAHRTLPCGTLITLARGARKVTVRVIDRGPFSGASVDLTARTRDYLGFTSGNVAMSTVKRYRVVPRA